MLIRCVKKIKSVFLKTTSQSGCSLSVWSFYSCKKQTLFHLDLSVLSMYNHGNKTHNLCHSELNHPCIDVLFCTTGHKGKHAQNNYPSCSAAAAASLAAAAASLAAARHQRRQQRSGKRGGSAAAAAAD